MTSIADNDTLILEQAVRWYLWLRDRRADPAKVDVFQRWCDINPIHRQAYERVERLDYYSDGIDALDLPWPSELELSLDRYDGSYALPLPDAANPLSNSIQPASSDFVLKQARLKKPRSLSKRFAAIAASIAVCAVLVGLALPRIADLFNPATSPVYLTDVGQQSLAQLPDGSMLTLGGSSRVKLAFSRTERRVLLDQGEVFFDIAKDSARPFIVTLGSSEIEAIGTMFNINKRQDVVTISVLEGIVDVHGQPQIAKVDAAPAAQVSRPVRHTERLSQGQELELDRRAGTLSRLSQSINLERANDWRQGRLAYVNERLDRVLEDVNRYSARTLILGDPVLGELRYTGTVFSSQIDAWIEALQQTFNIKLSSAGDNIVLLQDLRNKSS